MTGFWGFFFGSFQLTVELFDYLDCELKLSESGEEAAGPSRSPRGSWAIVSLFGQEWSSAWGD